MSDMPNMELHVNPREYIAMRRLHQGKLDITTMLCENNVDDYMDALDYMDEQDHISTVYLRLMSPGGEVYPSLALYDTIRAFRGAGRFHFEAEVRGYAASAASMIVLQAADHRLAQPSARFLVHEVSKFSFGPQTTSGSEDEAKEMRSLLEYIENLIAERSGRTHAEVHEAIERRDHWMSAHEALEFGLIDEVIGR